MKKVFILIISLLCGLVTESSFAQQTRTYSNEFLSLGVGARGLAMGNVQTALVDDVTAAYWNPAGLNKVNNLQVAAMHAEWFAGVSKYDYLGVAIPVADGKRTIGISAIRFGVDDIPNTLYLLNADGSINFDNVTAFSAADYAFLLSYAQTIGKLQIGGNAKIIHRRVGPFAQSWGMGIDLGIQYALSEQLILGVTAKDFPVSYNSWSFSFTPEEKEILQLTENIIPVNTVELTGQRIVAGLAYSLSISEKIALKSEFDIDFTFDGKRNTLIKSDFVSMDPHLGLELGYDDMVFFRFGLNNMQQYTNDVDGADLFSIQPNAGLGIKIRELAIDYAFTGLNRIGDGVFSHVFSLKIELKK